MSRYSPFRAAVLAASMSLAVAASSSAQTRPAYDDDYDGWQRIAQDSGYAAGLERGEADARARRAFNYTRDADYLRADDGYRRDLTSLDRYRRVFRQGFAAGYQEGYQGYSDMRGLSDVRQSSGIARDVRRSASADIAFEYGFADGYKAGVEDIRDSDKFQPTDHGAYRDGDRGYEGRYGERDVYKTEYRDGFRAGYTRGYREGRP
jgi:hypothetical protein